MKQYLRKVNWPNGSSCYELRCPEDEYDAILAKVKSLGFESQPDSIPFELGTSIEEGTRSIFLPDNFSIDKLEN